MIADSVPGAVYEVFSVLGHEGLYDGDFRAAQQRAREVWAETGAWVMVIDRASPAGYPSRVVFLVDADGEEYGERDVTQERWRELY